MTREQKCISLELAKKLQEVAKEAKFELGESEYCWIIGNSKLPYLEDIDVAKITIEIDDDDKKKKVKYIQAFDCSELGEILPKLIYKDDEYLKLSMWYSSNNFVHICYDNGSKPKIFPISDKSEANARCSMLIYLLENNLIK